MPSERLFSAFERWPDALFYAPVFFYWLWLSLRHRSLTLPTIANLPPALSGYLGESKSAALDLLGPQGRARVAPYAVFAASQAEDPAEDRARAARAVARAGISYPLVAKPDIGQNGAGVRIVPDEAALLRYLAAFPRGGRVIVQKYIEEEGEAGVFYVRYPHEERGRIVSLTLKFFPRVRGAGGRTLRELIEADPRARRIKHLYFKRHGARLDRAVPEGEEVRLISVGNHCKGAVFKNGAAEITPQMETAFDAIAREIPGFHFGRFDVRFASLEALKRGEGFRILEVNGADSEMTHIWDARATLAGAWRDQFYQFRTAFEIGSENRARGARAVGPGAFLAAWWRNRALIAAYTWEE
ncbi:MAG TPA: D-alanine--D-alanine ligase [Candidatus Paceibacterota bacterium]|nr:D-alanine--D-alanine ligase [Candidatus Paceibacterota bacterium]